MRFLNLSTRLSLRRCFAAAMVWLLLAAPAIASDILFKKEIGQYRIPAIVECKSGKLIAFSDHRYDGTDIGWGHHIDIVLKASCDGGKTWNQDELMVAKGGSRIETDFDCGHGDAAAVVDCKTGEILVMCASGGIGFWDSNRENPIKVGRYYSNDEGKTWKGEEVTRQIYDLMTDIKGGFFTSGRILQSSKIKVGSHYRIYSVFATDKGNRVLYSDDFGKNWGVLGIQTNATEAAPKGDEAKVEELPDGSILLSSRVKSGRYFNIYTYDNTKTATGKWAEVVFSSAECNGIAASDNACNGELVLAKAKKNGKKTNLLLQSVPLGPKRSNVAIFYKEIKNAADYANPQTIAKDWEGCFKVSNTDSGYSTMIQDRKGNILFLMEENFLVDHYDIVFDKLTISQITGNKYE